MKAKDDERIVVKEELLNLIGDYMDTTAQIFDFQTRRQLKSEPKPTDTIGAKSHKEILKSKQPEFKEQSLNTQGSI